MGEVEKKLELPNGLRAAFTRIMDPNYRVIEENYTELAMKLARTSQQLNHLTNDAGLYSNPWENLSSGAYNPESIGLPEYKKMFDYDAQVIAGFDLLLMGVLMKEWRIRHSDPEVVNTLTRSLKRMRYPSFREAMKAMCHAILYGFSVTEVVYENYEQYWMPRQVNGLKTFDPETIKFYPDEYGNLEKLEQDFSGSKIELPVDRMLIWSHEKLYGNWYGKAILRGVYKHWYIKDAMMKFSNIAHERFGSPVLKGTVSNKSEEDDMLTKLGHTYSRSQVVVTKRGKDDPTDIDILESKRTEAPFDKYIRYQDEMILRRMLISNRVFEGGGGTYGPKVPMDLVLMKFQDVRLELIDVVNTMLQMISDLNWADLKDYPVIEFKPLSSLDKSQIQKAIYDAIDKDIISKDEPWIRGELEFPEAEAGEEQEPKEELV